MKILVVIGDTFSSTFALFDGAHFLCSRNFSGPADFNLGWVDLEKGLKWVGEEEGKDIDAVVTAFPYKSSQEESAKCSRLWENTLKSSLGSDMSCYTTTHEELAWKVMGGKNDCGIISASASSQCVSYSGGLSKVLSILWFSGFCLSQEFETKARQLDDEDREPCEARSVLDLFMFASNPGSNFPKKKRAVEMLATKGIEAAFETLRRAFSETAGEIYMIGTFANHIKPYLSEDIRNALRFVSVPMLLDGGRLLAEEYFPDD